MNMQNQVANNDTIFIAPAVTQDNFTTPSSLSGIVQVPSSKSHSIRALLLASMAKGTSTIHNILLSEDTLSCINTLKTWGVICTQNNNTITIQSKGLTKLLYNTNTATTHNTPLHVDVGNSGTTLYLSTAIATLGTVPVQFDGDNSIRKRSAKDLLIALEKLGAKIQHNNNYCCPYTVQGPIHAGTINIHCPTSQYLSALLMALSFLQNKSTVHATLAGELPYIDMTLQWLKKYKVFIEHDKEYKTFAISGNAQAEAFSTTITGDYSSAAFFICAATLFSTKITLHGLDKNDVQADKHIIDILIHMGAMFEWNRHKGTDLLVTTSLAKLRGGVFNLKDMPDSLPILAVCACFAKSPTTFTGVAHARIKETDRIAIMAKELANIGISSKEHKDGITIYPSTVKGGTVESHGDHRIAMAFSIAALGSQLGIRIKNYTIANITYPNFYNTLESLGADIKIL